MKRIVDYEQSGVLPFRRMNDGIEVLLITSRRRGRWIIPKGLLEPHLSAPESAAAEAYEEAGVRGRVADESVGEYRYRKWGGVCRVKVYMLEVAEVLDEWPESAIRQRDWMSINDAIAVAQPKGLRDVLREVARRR